MAKNNDKKFNDKLDPAQGAETWKERFNIARTNQDRMFKRYADWYDSLYAQIGRVPSPWRSKVYAPVLAKQTWNLLAKFLTMKPGFEVEVKDDSLDMDEAARRADLMQHKLDFDWDNNYFDDTMRDKLFGPMLDAIVTGTGMFKVNWHVTKEKRFSRLTDAYGTIDLSKHKVKEIKHGFNDIVPVNAFSIFVSPAAKNLYSAPWIIIREYKPIAELEAINEAEGRQVYQNLDRLNGKVTYDTYAAYDRSRNRLLANADPTDKTVRMVAIYECYEKSSNMIYTYADTGNTGEGDKESQGWVLLRKTENPYWHGKYPLVKVHLKKKAFNFWGEGIFEINYRLQAAYNDIINHYIDAANVAFDPMLLAPEDANVDDYVIQPAGLVQYQGAVAPTPFKHIAPTPEQLSTPLTLFDQLIEGTTMPNYATGIADDKSDTTKGTATGIMRLQQAASDIVTFFRQNYMQSMTQLGKMWMSNNQQFMLRPVTVAVHKAGEAKSVVVSPEDLQGDMDLTIDESTTEPLTQEDVITVFNTYAQQLMTLQNQSFLQNQHIGTDPLVVDFQKLGQDLSEKYKMLDFSRILVGKKELDAIKQEQMQQAAQHTAQIMREQAQGAAQQGQGQQPKSLVEQLKIQLDKLPEDVQQKLILQIFGIQAEGLSPGEKALQLKAMDSVTKAAGQGHDMQMDRLGLSHDVAQTHLQHEQAQTQAAISAAQPAQTSNEGGNDEADTGSPETAG